MTTRVPTKPQKPTAKSFHDFSNSPSIQSSEHKALHKTVHVHEPETSQYRNDFRFFVEKKKKLW